MCTTQVPIDTGIILDDDVADEVARVQFAKDDEQKEDGDKAAGDQQDQEVTEDA